MRDKDGQTDIFFNIAYYKVGALIVYIQSQVYFDKHVVASYTHTNACTRAQIEGREIFSMCHIMTEKRMYVIRG